VPKPGVRLNLADLVENLPLGQSLGAIFDINNHGDMIGTGGFFSGGNFLLERIDATGPQSFATPDGTTQSPAEGRGHGVPPAVAAALLRHLPPLKPPLKSGSALP